MNSFRRGDVVLLNFPFSSGGAAKVRPTLVVQNDANNRRLTNTIVAMITRTTQVARIEATQLEIDLAAPAGQQSGLLHDSAVKRANLFTIEQQLIQRRIGSLPAAMQQIDGCLRAALGIG